jgi:hypothetical protein
MSLTNVPARTLWRAFDRLRRSHRHPSNMPDYQLSDNFLLTAH